MLNARVADPVSGQLQSWHTNTRRLRTEASRACVLQAVLKRQEIDGGLSPVAPDDFSGLFKALLVVRKRDKVLE